MKIKPENVVTMRMPVIKFDSWEALGLMVFDISILSHIGLYFYCGYIFIQVCRDPKSKSFKKAEDWGFHEACKDELYFKAISRDYKLTDPKTKEIIKDLINHEKSKKEGLKNDRTKSTL